MPVAPEASIDIAAWRGLVRVQGAVRRELDTALRASEGISLWDYTVLRTLAGSRGGCLRMTELARATDYTPSGLTRLADRLGRAGLVRRDPCPDDGRGSVATLTAEGRKAFLRARRTHLAAVRQRFLERFDQRELAQMAEFWERLLPGSTT